MELKNGQSDILLSDIAQGATTGTLTNGNFGTPSGAIYLVFDYDVAAKYEVKTVTVAGASMTSMSHKSGANVAHTAGCKIGRMMVAEVIDDLQASGATFTSPTFVTPALGTPASGVMTNVTGIPTTGLVDDAVTSAKLVKGLINQRQGGTTGDNDWTTNGTSNTDTSAKNCFIQCGANNTGAGANVTTTFPVAFAKKPVVLVTSTQGSNGIWVQLDSAASATAFATTSWAATGTVAANITFQWIAVGQ